MELQFQKIEQFLILINNTKDKGLEPLISHLLSDQDLFSFTQFLRHNNIKELNSQANPLKPWFDLLSIFAFGNFKAFEENAKNLPILTESQMKKLRKLTILDLASLNKILFYDDLLRELGLKTDSELEELIIEMIYQDLLVCRIDQRNKEVKITSCKGRDIKSEEIVEIKKNLRKILEKTSHIEDILKSKIDFLNQEKTKHMVHQQMLENEDDEIKNNFKKLITATSRQEGSRPIADFHSKGDGRK